MQIAYSSKCLVLFCAVLILCSVPISAQICESSNFTSAKFQSNLNIVLNNLVNNTSSSKGFNTSVSGQSPYTVYGLLQCRGDTTEEECLSCSQDANATIRKSCGNTTGGRSLLDKCFIRYQTYSFFGKLDLNFPMIYYNLQKVTNQPGVFRTAVRELFTNLSDEAPRSAIRYASRSTVTSTFYKINGLLQCWRDLTSAEDCRLCLANAIRTLLGVTLTDNATFVGGVTSSGSCIARYEIYEFFNPSPPPPSPIQLPSPPPIQQSPLSSPTPIKKSPNKIGIVLGIVSGLVSLLLLGVFAIRRKFKFGVLWIPGLLWKENPPGARDNLDREVNSAIGRQEGIVFNLENIKAATRNFHEDNKLGQGGFGDVYKGTMPNGTQIAVKRLSVQSTQGKKQFLNEVKLVAKIQHRNLVKLLGSCAEGSERLLVYEFLPNKSLDKILFHPERRKELDWSKRLNIILGIARGLLYLHQDSELRIIHRDIKASNILLNEKMQPKISDFGLARLFHLDETHVNTSIAGTLGYMAPEYVWRGQLSDKADIYSFGVLILEIICGRKNNDNRLSSKFQSLLEWVWISYNNEDIMDVIDRTIIESCNEQVSKYVQIGLLCTQANPSLRPPMANVHVMLSNPFMTNLPDPTKPAYISNTQNNVPLVTSPSTSISTSKSTSLSNASASQLVYPSINDITITNLSTR